MDAKTLRAAFPHTIPVLTGYLFLGFAYGLLMRNAGYPVWLAVLCSLAVYAGAAQYAAVPMLGVFDPEMCIRDRCETGHKTFGHGNADDRRHHLQIRRGRSFAADDYKTGLA